MLLGLYYFITFWVVPIQPLGCNIAINVYWMTLKGNYTTEYVMCVTLRLFVPNTCAKTAISVIHSQLLRK